MKKRMKNQMPTFVEKKKRDPTSTNPAKNTKGYSFTKAKTKDEDAEEQDRGGDIVPAKPMPNKADAAYAMLTKPRKSRGEK